jgi:hypothetical protein
VNSWKQNTAILTTLRDLINKTTCSILFSPNKEKLRNYPQWVTCFLQSPRTERDVTKNRCFFCPVKGMSLHF